MGSTGLVVAILCAVAAGCAGEEEGCPDGQYAYVVEQDGRTAIYQGCEVARQIRDTGTFEPTADEAYELIEVPSKLIPPDPADPTTVSLCDPVWQVHVEFHFGYCWPAEDPPDPGNPVVTQASPDDCFLHGDSGQTGVFGLVQIARQPDGHVSWAHEFFTDVYYLSERGTLDGFGGSYVTYAVPDEDLEDPLLEEPCGCSLTDGCPHPESPPGI